MPRLHRLFYVHKPYRSYTMIKNTTQTIFKVGDKLLKSNAKNSHRMGGKTWLGPYIIQKDLGKDRYCLKTLEGKAMIWMNCASGSEIILIFFIRMVY